MKYTTDAQKKVMLYSFIYQYWRIHGEMPTVSQTRDRFKWRFDKSNQIMGELVKDGKIIVENVSKSNFPRYELRFPSHLTAVEKRVPLSRSTVSCVKTGDVFEADDVFKSEDQQYRTIYYEVVGVYPYCVVARDIKTGIKRGFPYGTLVMMGLEKQRPELEALRRVWNY